jgi:hypothetical protein
MSKYQPALLGGLFIGVLSSLPVVSAANMCCCLWVISGGVLVVYLQQQATPMPVQTGDAVIGGLLAGIIGAIIWSLVLMVLTGVTGPMMQEEVRQALDQAGEVPPEFRDAVIRIMSGPNLALLVMVVSIPVWAVFGMVGALLGLAIFRKKTPPAVAQG